MHMLSSQSSPAGSAKGNSSSTLPLYLPCAVGNEVDEIVCVRMPAGADELANDLSAERSMVSHCITRLPVASRDRAQADADLESAITLREKLKIEQQDADRRLREADDRWQMASSALAAHRPGRPGLFALLSGRGRTTRRIWENEHAELNSRFVAADRERDSVSRTARDVTNRLAAACSDEGTRAADAIA